MQKMVSYYTILLNAFAQKNKSHAELIYVQEAMHAVNHIGYILLADCWGKIRLSNFIQCTPPHD